MVGAAERTLPFRVADQPDAHWQNESGTVLLAAWTNEPEQADRPLLRIDADRAAAGFSGYLNGDLPPVDQIADPSLTPEVGGVWSLFSADDSGIAAATCASGAEVVFYAETAERVVIGNRALLVHLVANPDGPVPDLVGLAGVFNSGYCVTDRTAFEGTRSLSASARIVADRTGRVQMRPYGADQGIAVASEVAEALVSSVAPLRASDRPVRLGLTGGRDSRLLIAVLTNAGVAVSAHTSGLPDDPDVIVAREVAARLTVPHKVGRPMGATVDDSSVTFDVRSRVKEAVVLSEGMLSAYDRVGRIDGRHNANTVPFAGSGGEILRAYYAGSLADPDDLEAAVRYMRGRLFQSAKRMTRDLRAAYETDTDPWMRAARATGAASLEDFYVRQRTGRWTGAARSSASIGSLARRPYLDHRVVSAVRQVSLHERMNERLIADVLDVLAPELKDVRFAGRRWKFDEVPPTDPALLTAWELQAPVQGAHGDQASLNWRTDLPEVRRELASIILDAPDSFWQLADRKKVSDFVGKVDGRTRADTMKMWHMATIADALGNDFHAAPSRFAVRSSEVVAARPTTPVPLKSKSKLERTARSLARRVRDRVRR